VPGERIYQMNSLSDEQKKLILKLKCEGNSGGKIGKILRINRFTVCHFLKRNENQENVSLIRSARKSKCGRKRQSSERSDS
jgi:IS30 family transposase